MYKDLKFDQLMKAATQILKGFTLQSDIVFNLLDFNTEYLIKLFSFQLQIYPYFI
jgi:hypothetical protein